MSNRNRSPRLDPGSIWLRLFCNKRIQFLILIFVTIASVGVYLVAHKSLRDTYMEEAVPIYRESLRLFRIGQDNASGKLSLFYRSRPLPEQIDYSTATPMGVAKHVSVQGILERFKGAISQLNVLLKSHSRRLFDSQEQIGQNQDVRIFLHDWIEDSGSPEKNGHPPQRVWVTLSPEDRSAIENYLQFGYFDSVIDILLSKKAYYLKLANNAKGSKVSQSPLDQLAHDVTSQISELSANQIGERPLTTKESERIEKQILSWKRELNSEILKIFQDLCKDAEEHVTKECRTTINYIVKSNTTDIDSISPINLLNELLVCNLLNTSFKETGYIWLVGRFKWLEIVFWTVFGVMTQALVQQGFFLVGAKGNRVWNPSENLRVIAKLLYAPLLTVALFFGIGYLGETKELTEFTNATLVPLLISFILGMYPNTAYRFMKRITRSFFSEEVTSSPHKPPPQPAKTKVTLEQQPKTIQELSASLKKTVKAPLSQYAKEE